MIAWLGLQTIETSSRGTNALSMANNVNATQIAMAIHASIPGIAPTLGLWIALT